MCMVDFYQILSPGDISPHRLDVTITGKEGGGESYVI